MNRATRCDDLIEDRNKRDVEIRYRRRIGKVVRPSQDISHYGAGNGTRGHRRPVQGE
jgi:hypothetical protein